MRNSSSRGWPDFISFPSFHSFNLVSLSPVSLLPSLVWETSWELWTLCSSSCHLLPCPRSLHDNLGFLCIHAIHDRVFVVSFASLLSPVESFSSTLTSLASSSMTIHRMRLDSSWIVVCHHYRLPQYDWLVHCCHVLVQPPRQQSEDVHAPCLFTNPGSPPRMPNVGSDARRSMVFQSLVELF